MSVGIYRKGRRIVRWKTGYNGCIMRRSHPKKSVPTRHFNSLSIKELPRVYEHARQRTIKELVDRYRLDQKHLVDLLYRIDDHPWHLRPEGCGPTYSPLRAALKALGPGWALQLFEQTELRLLSQRAAVFAALTQLDSPPCERRSLCQLTERFRVFLEADGNHVGEHGHPSMYFASSRWIDALLARTYYVRRPWAIRATEHGTYWAWTCVWGTHGFHPIQLEDPGIPWDEGKNVMLDYVWSEAPPLEPNLEPQVLKVDRKRYEEIPPLLGLDQCSAEKLEKLRRKKLYPAKLEVLAAATRHLESGRPGLLEESLNTLREHGITAEDHQFLMKIEEVYRLQSAKEDTGENGYIEGTHGGLSDLFRFIQHCETVIELNATSGFERLRGKMESKTPWVVFEEAYFEALAIDEEGSLDRVLDRYWRMMNESDFDQRLDRGLREDLGGSTPIPKWLEELVRGKDSILRMIKKGVVGAPVGVFELQSSGFTSSPELILRPLPYSMRSTINVARLVGTGSFDGVDWKLGWRQLFFLHLFVTRSERLRALGEENLAVKEPDAVEEFEIWVRESRLQCGPSETPQRRLRKNWSTFLRNTKAVPPLSGLFQQIDHRGERTYVMYLPPGALQAHELTDLFNASSA